MSELVKYSEQTFESIKHIDEYGEEYWLARELQPVLEYSQWRRFSDSIERAKLACKNSGFRVEDHFANVGKMVDIGSGAEREIDDVKLFWTPCGAISARIYSNISTESTHRGNRITQFQNQKLSSQQQASESTRARRNCLESP